MEGRAGAAILQVLVQNLIDLSKKETLQIHGLDKEAEMLTESLYTIQKFLNDVEMRTIHGEGVRSWLKKLEDAVFDADNVLDELNYHHLSNQIQKHTPMKRKEQSGAGSSSDDHIASQQKMVLGIKQINECLDSIKKEATELGLVARLSGPTLIDASFETDCFNLDPVFIGRDDVVLEIAEMLTTTSITSDERVTILPVVGMGGLGKTTLTRKVFNHQKVEAQFRLRIWIYFSQSFDPLFAFKKMVEETLGYEMESRQDVLEKLQEALKDKNYLLVLDDVTVSNEDSPKWEYFISSLVEVTSTKGNAIIVTTRNMEVASIVNPHHKHELRGLSDEDCWSMIKAKTFKEVNIPSEFETTGRKIARKCQGSPLAANVIGGFLRNKSEEKWLEIERTWLSQYKDGETITKILRLSFDNLSPPSLKNCFAYCSMFSKGYRIIRKELIDYWMAEGFLQAHGSSDMESVGEEFINALLFNSLMQVEERDYYGNVKVCVMHDLVHDFACLISDSGSQNRYRSLKENKSNPIKKEDSKHLRTLLADHIFCQTLFSDFESLRVLGLYSYRFVKLPCSIRELIHLRELDISCTEILELPQWIGELYHLQTLRGERLRKLPSTLKYLINLRHLYIHLSLQLPAEIGRLTCLQMLERFRVGDENGFKIEELGSLNDLKGEMVITNLERVGGKEEAEKANLCKKSKLSELRLQWSTKREGETNDENVLEGLQPHSNLKRLAICGFEGKRFPSWTLKMAVQNVPRGTWVGLDKLIEISLWCCYECEEIPMLGHLPNLKSLKLQILANLKCLTSSFYGLVNEDTHTVFPALERLELSEMPELAEWEELEFSECGSDEVKVFPRLQHFKIEKCHKLMSVPTHFSSSRLQHLQVWDSGLSDCFFVNCSNLSSLDLRDCPNLTKVPDGVRTLSSLEELIIERCPNLEMIADYPHYQQLQGSCIFTSLHHLEIDECPALVHLPCEMIGPSLKTLCLEGLISLKNLPSLIDRLPNSPHLKVLKIIGVPNFMASTPTWPLCSLTAIYFDLSTGPSMATVDGILQGCSQSLTGLTFKGTEILECLPQSLQHLTALQWLALENFGVEELPEWLGNLSSLKRLSLYKCKKLKRLPSVDAMRRLTSLEQLEVDACPELILNQGEEAGSEWPKISHISNLSLWVLGDYTEEELAYQIAASSNEEMLDGSMEDFDDEDEARSIAEEAEEVGVVEASDLEE